jgi:hypothetical protein
VSRGHIQPQFSALMMALGSPCLGSSKPQNALAKAQRI